MFTGSIAGLDILGKSVKSEVIAVYLEDSAIESLASKWKSKIAEELAKYDFLKDIISGESTNIIRLVLRIH